MGFQCRFDYKNYNYISSILSISPETECTESTGYPDRYSRKEKIGHCFPERNEAEGLVPLHKYYHAALDAHFYTSDKDDVDLDECEYEGIMCYVYPESISSVPIPSFVPVNMPEKKDLLKVAEQVPQSPIDLIIMLDSSGSVADEDFLNWQAEIDYAASLIDSEFVTPGSRVALINYSGCGPKVTFEECQKKNKLKLEWGLLEYSTKEEVLARLDLMGPGDFNYGYTWTDEALSIAFSELNYAPSHTGILHEKWIVLLTAGEPSIGHEACKASTDYESQTVDDLETTAVNFYTVGISMTQDTMDEYFGCLDRNIYTLVDSFDNLYDIHL